MSLRSKTEESFRKRIIKKIKDRGGKFGRVVQDSSKYGKGFTFKKIKMEPIHIAKIIYPIHSYEIFEMENDEIEKIEDKFCEAIESFFILKISDFPPNSVICYEDSSDIHLSLDYRIATIYVKYNITTL